MAQASIITIGDELLIGQVVDTNSAWMAQVLNKSGIAVRRRLAVGDSADDIVQALDDEAAQADIILITGGLGPTADDITKPVLCKYFNGKMVVDQGALENVRTLFEKVFKKPVTERNLKQAEVPDNCKVIPNKRGSAPGMWFEKDGKVFVSMPGVPHEMKAMLEDVVPLLIKKFEFPFLVHRTLVTFGMGESAIADLLIKFEESLSPTIKLAYLPNFGMVRLRLSSSGTDADLTTNEIDEKFAELKSLLSAYVISEGDETMEKVVGKLLVDRGKTLCTAESCTGGYIAHLLTSLPGSSRFYDGSVVSYSYKAKQDLLEIDEDLLLSNGAVSENVVIRMAAGALKKLGSDYAIAVSGIMGPAGGTADKPVGTVWIAAGNKKKILARKFEFRFDRERNVQATAANALNYMRQFIINDQS